MALFENNASTLVADVDCIGDGKQLCDQFGVDGYPTIKWGDAEELREYEGNRDIEELKRFAFENLKPMCSVFNIDLCDDKQRGEIEILQKVETSALNDRLDKMDEEIKLLNDKFENESMEMEEMYQGWIRDKDEKISPLKKRTPPHEGNRYDQGFGPTEVNRSQRRHDINYYEKR